MYCICCKKDNVKPIDYGSDDKDKLTEEEYLWMDEPNEHHKDGVGPKKRTIDNINTDSGIIQRLSAGYGSGHDTSMFIIAICDECITENLEDGTLLFWGNYMSPGSQWTKEDLEKSKLIYRRRKNLDSLV